jgi:hypothetical protein
MGSVTGSKKGNQLLGWSWLKPETTNAFFAPQGLSIAIVKVLVSQNQTMSKASRPFQLFSHPTSPIFLVLVN